MDHRGNGFGETGWHNYHYYGLSNEFIFRQQYYAPSSFCDYCEYGSTKIYQENG
ncbi:MAG TPA: hypothetical protein VIP70_13585 [Nitrososphaeraceae archaeon]